MYLDELITITEKLRAVEIGNTEAQESLNAAVVYLDVAIMRIRDAAQHSVHPTGGTCPVCDTPITKVYCPVCSGEPTASG